MHESKWGIEVKLLILILFLCLNTNAKVEWGELIESFPGDEEIREVISPAMSYRTLLEWGTEGDYKCLIYRISSQEQAIGILYFGQRKYRGCSLSQKKDDRVIARRIKKLRVKLTKSKSGQSYQVITHNSKGKEELRKWEFPFSEKGHQRWSGFSLSLPKLKKREVIENDKTCSYFDTKELKVNFKNCQQCRGTLWTPVFNRLSASYPIAICGASRCGERNQHPCLKMTSLKSPISCDEAKRLVYCQSGKQIICLGSGFLECR